MKKIILSLSAFLLIYAQLYAQCPANTFALNVATTSEVSAGPPAVIDSSCIVFVGNFQPNALVYIYNNSSVLVDSISTDPTGAGLVTLSSANCLSWAQAGNVGTAVSGTCTTSIVAAGGILPVELTEFEASLVNNKVKCNWATAGEVPGTLYQLQASSDGIGYKTIYSLKSSAALNSSQQYQYTLPQQITTQQFYRLKFTEPISAPQYSQVRVVSPAGYVGMLIYPSVTSQQFSVSLSANYLNGQLKIYNTSGIMVYQNKITTTGFNVTANWGKGLYYIRAISADGINSSVKTVTVQ